MTAVSSMPSRDSDGYEDFSSKIRERFASLAGPFFMTDVDCAALWRAYLDNLPGEARQHYNCQCCRDFIRRAGGLVTIDETGRTHAAMWDASAVPQFFRESVEAMRRLVNRAKVTGVFLSAEAVIGTPQSRVKATGWTWHHLSVPINPCKTVVLTAEQQMAEKLQDREMLHRGLAELTIPIVRQAKALLETETLYRSEKCLGVATWLLALMERMDGAPKAMRDNLVWSAVATAPPGFCHIRSTMISTLLDDLTAGLPIDVVKSRFAEKMNPLQYQRPQAAPTSGNIKRAEEIVAKLAAAGSLKRRFARLEDLRTVWKPKDEPQAAPAGGVFGHLLAKQDGPVESGASQTMTWEKFFRVVLPTAERIEVLAPSTGSYCQLVTTCDQSAPPILQWDFEDARNPVNWYYHSFGGRSVDFNIRPGWRKVTAICLKPSQWGEKPMDHQGKGIRVIIDGCRDMGENGGLAIFPEILRSEFHEVRATIEAFSRSGKLEGREESSAAGLGFDAGSKVWDCNLRVTAAGVVATYKIDRWD